jgi:hypothetical protein
MSRMLTRAQSKKCKDKPKCDYGYDEHNKKCKDKPYCEYGYDEHTKKCKDKPKCDYGYDDYVRSILESGTYQSSVTCDLSRC